jgi:signal transduction histidine kinase
MECAAPDPEALAGVAAELAHEFNNLFAGVLGYIELLLDEFATGDPRRQDIEAIRRSIERAVALTSRLHAVASRRDGPRSA